MRPADTMTYGSGALEDVSGRRWLDASAALGALAWAIGWSVDVPSHVGLPLVERVVMLGPLVAAPLAIEAGLRPVGRFGPHRLVWCICRFQPIAAGCAAASIVVGTGTTATILASVWVVQALLVALLGALRLLRRGLGPVSELAVDAGHLYLPIGATWLLASRVPYPLMGFNDLIVLLTAAHFHFAGLSAPVVVGQVGRLIEPASRMAPLYRHGAIWVSAAPILVAIGITWSPLLEVVMACLLAWGILVVAFVTVIHVAPRGGWHLVLGGGALVLLLTMALAVVYAVGEYLERPFLLIPRMAELHGAVNAIAYAVVSLVALRMLSPRRLLVVEDVPLMPVPGRRRIGPRFFDERVGAEATALVPSLAEMMRVEHPEAEPSPDVAAFYERTTSLKLLCAPEWRGGFRLPGRLFVAFARRMQQLVLPVAEEPHEILSALHELPDAPLEDARIGGAVTSVRTYGDGSAMYVAVYAAHEDGLARYMNIAMPLPLGTFCSVLRAEPLAEGGLRLGSARVRGHEGLWWRVGPFVIRLPLRETLVAHAASSESGAQIPLRGLCADDAVMVAEHRFHLFGLPCLALSYVIARL